MWWQAEGRCCVHQVGGVGAVVTQVYEGGPDGGKDAKWWRGQLPLHVSLPVAEGVGIFWQVAQSCHGKNRAVITLAAVPTAGGDENR